MRLLCNENLPGTVIRTLRTRGHDVVAAKESLRGASDATILAKAQAEERLVVTQDKDFGELAFRHGLPAPCGVLLFRLSGTSPDVDTQRMIAVIESEVEWAGQFIVATDERIRVRPLPPPISPDPP